jgi:hypothetical protein
VIPRRAARPLGRSTLFGRTARFQVGSLAPTLFTYDDSTTGTRTGTQQLSLTEQVDPGGSPSSLLDRETAYTYFPVGSGEASGYLKQIAHLQPRHSCRRGYLVGRAICPTGPTTSIFPTN